MQENIISLTDAEVTLISATATLVFDPRASAAALLSIVHGLNLSAIRQLRWHHMGPIGGVIGVRSGTEASPLPPVTPTVREQLLRIDPSQFHPRVFARRRSYPLSIDCLCSLLLRHAGLVGCDWNRIAAWSSQRSFEARLAIACPKPHGFF
jgi:hypothetical protein